MLTWLSPSSYVQKQKHTLPLVTIWCCERLGQQQSKSRGCVAHPHTRLRSRPRFEERNWEGCSFSCPTEVCFVGIRMCVVGATLCTFVSLFCLRNGLGIFHKFSSTGCGIANTKCIGQHFKGRSRNTRRHEDAIWVFFLSLRWKNNMLTIGSCICRSVFFGATVALYFVSRLPNLNSPNCFQHMNVSTRVSWFLRVVVSAGHFRVVMFHMVHQGCTVSGGHIPIHRASMR